MQIFITDNNFYESAKNLDTKRLLSQIYEAIQILASLLNINDKLVNPKRNVKNHPVAKLWMGYESHLFKYLKIHIIVWTINSKKSLTELKETVTMKNFKLLKDKIIELKLYKGTYPSWITDELIQTHR